MCRKAKARWENGVKRFPPPRFHFHLSRNIGERRKLETAFHPLLPNETNDLEMYRVTYAPNVAASGCIMHISVQYKNLCDIHMHIYIYIHRSIYIQIYTYTIEYKLRHAVSRVYTFHVCIVKNENIENFEQGRGSRTMFSHDRPKGCHRSFSIHIYIHTHIVYFIIELGNRMLNIIIRSVRETSFLGGIETCKSLSMGI